MSKCLTEAELELFDRALFKKKCDSVFEVMLNHASRGRKRTA